MKATEITVHSRFGESEKDSSVSEFYYLELQLVSNLELIVFGVVDST